MSKPKKHHAAKKNNPWSLAGPAVERIRSGKTGFDPLGARQEAAFAQGLVIRNLFTGRLRTRKGWLIGLMTLAGVFFILPLVLFLMDSTMLHRVPLALLVLIPVGLVGIALLVNALLSAMEQH
jgi:hypothetical protein